MIFSKSHLLLGEMVKNFCMEAAIIDKTPLNRSLPPLTDQTHFPIFLSVNELRHATRVQAV